MKLETNLQELFSKYLAGRASADELLQLLDYFQEENDSEQLCHLILAELEKEDANPATEGHRAILGRVSMSLYKHVQQSQSKIRKLYWSIGTVAAVIFCVGSWIGARYLTGSNGVNDTKQLAIVPGEDKAILRLEDGTVIDLNSEVEQDSEDSYLSKDSDGIMTFNTQNLAVKEEGERTLRTPKGGQFAAILPDGTKVWLNAESSITFPTRFARETRIVDITGEVYFEVAHQKDQPFLVHARKQTIRVLGTHFNVNAYPERSQVQTSLLEGKVAVSAGGNHVLLKSGEMCLWNETNGGLTVGKIADIGNILAWKDGMFSFDNNSIQEIMQTVARWYDVDFSFEEGDYSDCVFDGMVPKKESIEQVLKILSTSQQLNFAVKDRKVLVSRAKNDKN